MWIIFIQTYVVYVTIGMDEGVSLKYVFKNFVSDVLPYLQIFVLIQTLYKYVCLICVYKYVCELTSAVKPTFVQRMNMPHVDDRAVLTSQKKYTKKKLNC